MITIKQKLTDEIKLHGESEYPSECCGMLIGKLLPGGNKTVEKLLPISNAREEENRHNRFLITSEEMMRGELAARKHKLDIVGFYHSHPDHPAVPSDYDREHAWPTYSYIIVAVGEKKAGDFFSWELENDRSHFNAENLTIEG